MQPASSNSFRPSLSCRMFRFHPLAIELATQKGEEVASSPFLATTLAASLTAIKALSFCEPDIRMILSDHL